MLLHIHRLPAQVSLGVHDWEKHERRQVLIDVQLHFDGRAAAVSDALADTLDYAAIERHILLTVQARHFDLLEAMVAAVGDALLALPQTQTARVEIFKPGALAHAENVSIAEEYSR